MSKFMKAFKRGEKGFTMIELLIVIAILGILAAVAIPSLSHFIGQSKVSAANTELGMVKTSMAAEMTDAQLGKISDGLTGSSLTTDILDATHDFTLISSTGNFTISKYIQGGLISLKGDYKFNDDGTVNTAHNSDVPNQTVNDANPLFK